MSPNTPRDELLERYAEAKAALPDGLPDTPNAALRERIMQAARGQAVAINNVASEPDSTGANGLNDLKNRDHPQITNKEAANDSFWSIKALASLAVMGLSALLWWQFEQGTPEEQQAAQSAEPSSAAVTAPFAQPAPTFAPPPEPARSSEQIASKNEAPPAPAATAIAQAPAASPPPATAAGARKEAQTSKPSEAKIADADMAASNAAPARKTVPAPEAARSRVQESAPAAPQISQADKATTETASSSATAMPAQRSLEDVPVSRAAAPRAAPTPEPSYAAGSAAPPVPAIAPPRPAQARAALIPSPEKLLLAIETKDADALRQALAQGASPNARTPTGNPALTQSVLQRWTEGVRILLAAGADRNARNNKGHTADDVAQVLGDQEIIELLKASR